MSQELGLKIKNHNIISCVITLSRERQMSQEGRPRAVTVNDEVAPWPEGGMLKN